MLLRVAPSLPPLLPLLLPPLQMVLLLLPVLHAPAAPATIRLHGLFSRACGWLEKVSLSAGAPDAACPCSFRQKSVPM